MQKPSRTLTVPQFILVIVLLIGTGIYQYFIQESNNDQTGTQPEAATIQITPTGSPVETAEMVQATVSNPQPGVFQTVDAGKLSKFDYFVLSLSWSPDYCASNGSSDPQQCSIGRKLGFVLHGLWPQNNQGYPSHCSTARMGTEVKARFPGLYPSASLYDHEWETHGTCSGLSPEQFLALSSQIKNSVNIPAAFRSPQAPFRISVADLIQQFVQTNPTFSASDFEVNCSSTGRYLKELYVCFSREGKPSSCSRSLHQEALKSCQQADFLVRNTR